MCALSWPEEVFYRRLMSIVDDYGRVEALPQLLRARCYPLQTDLVRVADITRWMAACLNAGLIVHYEVAGKQYLQIEKFGQQQRSASKCPGPLANDFNCNQPLANAHLVVVVDGDVDEGEKPARKRASPTLKTKLPEDFAVSERVKVWAADKGHSRLAQHLESFRSKCIAKGYAYVDWDEAFMGAIRDDWAKLKAIPFGVVPLGSTVQSDAAERTRQALAAEATRPVIGPSSEARAALMATRNSIKATA